MKKKSLLKILAGATLFFNVSTLGALNLGAFAVSATEKVKVPTLGCIVQQKLEKGDSSGLLDILATIDQNDNNLKVTFNNQKSGGEVQYKLPDLEEDESYFAVFIDRDKGPLENAFLTKNDDGTYTCEFDAPYYSNVIDIHIYKQKNSDPNFNIDAEQFIGRTKVLMAHDSSFARSASQELTVLDSTGNKIEDASLGTVYLNRITPNFYSISSTSPTLAGWDNIGRIVLPDGKKDAMSLDDTIVPDTYYRTGAQTIGNNASTSGGYYNFYLPDDVDEFTFQIFKTNVTDNATDIKYQFKIKITRNV